MRRSFSSWRLRSATGLWRSGLALLALGIVSAPVPFPAEAQSRAPADLNQVPSVVFKPAPKPLNLPPGWVPCDNHRGTIALSLLQADICLPLCALCIYMTWQHYQ